MLMIIPRYVLSHLIAGCLAGVVAALMLFATNIGSLRDLVLQTSGGFLALGLLTFGCVVTFGSIAVGHAVMTMGDDTGE